VALSTFLLSCGGSSDAGSGDSKKLEDANRCKITVAATTGGKVKISKYLETTEIVLIGSEIEVVATADEGYEFTGWYLGDSTEPVSTDAVFTFVATKNTTLTAHFTKLSNPVGEAIDLGLPSGTKWANMNVGASAPEDYGGYYAWGETEEKSNYEWSTYKWCNGSYNTMTKYCTDSSNGIVDNKTTLDSQDDVAHVKWGGTWRMPTMDEQKDLLNMCTWTWTTQNGVKGYKVTGPNGNSIFLPAAGYRDGEKVYGRGVNGFCWSSSLNSGYSSDASSLYFISGGYYCYDYNRYYGRSVRPVCD
jgi:uncharacterized repeat protein (TIGR02543 family)